MKAVIKVGGKQFIVAEKETLLVDRLPDGTKELETDVLLTIDGDKTEVGAPFVKGIKVKAKVVDAEVKGDKMLVDGMRRGTWESVALTSSEPSSGSSAGSESLGHSST